MRCSRNLILGLQTKGENGRREIWKLPLGWPHLQVPSPGQSAPIFGFKFTSSLGREHTQAHKPQTLHNPMKTQPKWRQAGKKTKRRRRRRKAQVWLSLGPASLAFGTLPVSAPAGAAVPLATLSPSIPYVPTGQHLEPKSQLAP